MKKTFFLILCFHRLCRASELLGCMSFGVCSLMEPDKVSQNEQIPFPNAFLHGGFPSLSDLACVLSAHPSDHERSGFSSACVNSSDLNIRGGGNTLRSAVSLLSPADTGATTALSVSPSQLKRHGSHTSPLYCFTVSLQKFSIAVYHVAHKTFVTLTGVTLEKSGVFWRRKMSRWQTLCCCNLLCFLLSGNNKDLSRSSLSSAPALEPSESQHILFSSHVARIAAVSRGLWLYRWQQCAVSCPRSFDPFRQITHQPYLLSHIDLFKILLIWIWWRNEPVISCDWCGLGTWECLVCINSMTAFVSVAIIKGNTATRML